MLEADLREISDVMSSVTISREKLLPGERREVAVLFVDLHGFTSMSEGLDHETVHRLSSGIMRALSRTIEAHGGYLDKYEGDKIMALFGAIRSHTDDCERAVSTGLRMLEIIDQIHGILLERQVSIGARVGISYGSVTVAPDPSGHLTATGDEVNIAARMESTAEVDSVQVTKSVRERCGESFTWLDLGKRSVRGRKMSVHTFQPIGEGEDLLRRKRAAFDLGCHFINREEELKVLRDSFSHSGMDASGCRILFLKGFDGLGKTRLVREFAEGLIEDDAIVLFAETSPYAQKPFQLWISALSDSLTSLPDTITDINQNSADCVLRMLGRRDQSKPTEMSPLQLKDKQVKSIVDVIQWIALHATGGRLLIIADNLQSMDSSSAEVLNRLLASDISAVNILIIGCLDPSGLSYKHWMDSLLDGLPDRIGILDVPPLDENNTLFLIRALLDAAGTTAKDSIADQLLERIFSRSHGNPFITVEIVKLLIEKGILKRHDHRWTLANSSWDEILPESVKGLVRCRIDSFALQDRRILQIAALVGARFDANLIRKVVEQFGTDLLESLDRSLCTLVKEGILDAVSRSESKDYEFTSSTYQDIACSTVLRQNRLAIHTVTAEQMTDLYSKESGRFFRDISLHWRAAERFDMAIEAGIAALDYLTETYQNEECLAMTDLIEQWVGSTHPEDSDDTIMTVLIKRQNIQYRLARFTEMDITLQRQLELGQSRGFDAELAKTYCSLGELRRVQRKFLEAESYLEKSILYSRKAADMRTLGMSLSNLGALLYELGESNRAVRNFTEAISVQEECGNIRSTGIAMLNLSEVLIESGDIEKGKGLLQRSLELFEKTGYKTGEACTLSYLGILAEEDGREEDALELLQRAAELLKETGYRHGLAPVLASLGRLQINLDSAGKAEETLLAALELLNEISDPNIEALTLSAIGSIALNEGRIEEASERCREALKLVSDRSNSIKPETVRMIEDLRSALQNSE